MRPSRRVRRTVRRARAWPLRAALALLAVASALGAVVARAPFACAKGGPKEAAAPPVWGEEDGRTVLRVSSPRPLKAYVVTPTHLPEAGKLAELLVVLHGHGGTATGLLQYGTGIAGPREAFVLACEGSGSLETDRGTGHSWDGADAGAIVACVDAMLAKHPVDPKRVVLLGHSAGGSMSLEAYRTRPGAFAGIVTSAAPRTPSTAQKGARVAVMLGTKDPNIAGAAAAIAATEKALVGRVLLVTDLPHELPRVAYAQECVAWVLDSKAGSDLLHVPLEEGHDVFPPPDSPAAKAKGKGYRHVLLPFAGARGAAADALPRAEAKAKATELAMRWKKAPAGTDLGDDVAAASACPLSKDTRGVVTGLVLARYGGGLALALGKLKGGDVTGPVESDAGWHVVARDRAD